MVMCQWTRLLAVEGIEAGLLGVVLVDPAGETLGLHELCRTSRNTSGTKILSLKDRKRTSTK